MTKDEKNDLILQIYRMYYERNYTQESIAKELGIKTNIVGEITRIMGYKHTVDTKHGKRLFFILDDFKEVLEKIR